MAGDAPTIGPDTGGFPVPDKDDLYAPRPAFPDSGAAWDKDIYVSRPRWNERLDQNYPADPRTDPGVFRKPDESDTDPTMERMPRLPRQVRDT